MRRIRALSILALAGIAAIVMGQSAPRPATTLPASKVTVAGLATCLDLQCGIDNNEIGGGGGGGSGGITAVGDCGANACFVGGGTGTGTAIRSNTSLTFELDDDDNSIGQAFIILGGNGSTLFNINELDTATFGVTSVVHSASTPTISFDDTTQGGSPEVSLSADCVTNNDCSWQIYNESGTAGTLVGMLGVNTVDAGDSTLYLGGAWNNTSFTTGTPPTNAVTVNEAGLLKRLGSGSVEANTIATGTAFPGSPATNDLFVVTDDTTIGACDSGGGSARSLCRFTGSAWQSLGDGGSGGGAITNPLNLDSAGTVNDDSCTGQQGQFWYDQTDDQFEFCAANAGVPQTLKLGTDGTFWCLDTDIDGTYCEASEPNLSINAPLGTTGNETVQGTLTVTSTLSATVTDTKTWGAAGMSTDGTNCVTPAEVTLNSGPKVYAFTCADSNSSIFYGSTAMPDSWNGGDLTWELWVWHGTSEAITFGGDFSSQCRGPGEIPSATWSTTPRAADVTITTANQVEHAITTTPDTPAGTCAGGDTLYWRYVVSATRDSTNAANTKVLWVTMEFTKGMND